MGTNGKTLALPDAVTGPGSKAATLTRSMDRYAVPPEMREAIASALKSGMLPSSIRTPEQAVVVALKARELGLPMMQGFASIHVIQGVPTLSASLLLGIAYKRLPGFDLQVVERSGKRCVLRARRSPQHSVVEVSYTWDEAVTAGLTGKDNWKKNPAAMLFARAAGALCRIVAPDTFMGLYTPEEVESGAVLDAEPIEAVAPYVPPQEVVAEVVPEKVETPAEFLRRQDTQIVADCRKELFPTKTTGRLTADEVLALARAVRAVTEPTPPADDFTEEQ